MTSRGAGSPWLAAEVLDMPSLSQPTSIGFLSPLSLSLLYAGSAAKEAVPDRAAGQGQGSRAADLHHTEIRMGTASSARCQIS